jgi:hypothetical protein
MTAELICFRTFSIPYLRNHSRPALLDQKNTTMPRRKTYNYLLLLFIVFSGLAGTPTDDVLSKKERKFAGDFMKSTKMALGDAIKGLSPAQLDYKPAADRWSVKECVYHIAISEKNLWAMLETSMKAAATPEKKKELKVTDEQVIKMIEDRTNKVKTFPAFEPQNTGYKSLEEAMNDFKTNRATHIKYIKATSEDLRNHFVQMPFGLLDCYQLCLMISAHTNRHTHQLNEVKGDPGFPK